MDNADQMCGHMAPFIRLGQALAELEQEPTENLRNRVFNILTGNPEAIRLELNQLKGREWIQEFESRLESLNLRLGMTHAEIEQRFPLLRATPA